jgi:hypothetical protein
VEVLFLVLLDFVERSIESIIQRDVERLLFVSFQFHHVAVVAPRIRLFLFLKDGERKKRTTTTKYSSEKKKKHCLFLLSWFTVSASMVVTSSQGLEGLGGIPTSPGTGIFDREMEW